MPLSILLTSTSFQDTPGEHQEFLNSSGLQISKLRGPLEEKQIISIIDKYDGIICGDDEITRAVIEKGAKGKLKAISKYGTGLDKIDLDAAKKFNISVKNCPAVNQTTVAEHVFALLLSYIKNIIQEHKYVQKGHWTRLIGSDLKNKTLGVIGTGNIGKEVIKRAKCFGMNIIGFDLVPDYSFQSKYNFNYVKTLNELFNNSDIISLHLNLNDNSRHIINKKTLLKMKKGVIIVNTARAELVEQCTIINGINSGIIEGYLTDVLEKEPIQPKHPYLNNLKIVITPHIGSRTFENVVKQGKMAVENLLFQLNK